ncbi:MAG TPA: hypothetical protein PK514_04055 [Spirochaetota bacterium]|nr:hypothetical protein [Spirochaetota bacterium]
MKELIELINTGITARTSDLSMQKKVWESVTEFFRPDINLYRNTRPSVVLARETGDLGLAVLWVVQAALARPVLKDLTLNLENASGISPVVSGMNDKTILSLAHSESPAAPVTYMINGEVAVINGTKKFITAGRNSGLIMITCRETGAPKIDRIALVNNKELPAGAMNPLDLKIMRTIDHTSLTLNEFDLDAERLPSVDPRVIRRSVKKWGIVERALIMESFIAFLLYCEYVFSELGVTIASDDEIISLLEKQTESASKQLEEAVFEKQITTGNAGMEDVIKLAGRFQHAYYEKEHTIPADEKIRLADLFLFNNLKG